MVSQTAEHALRALLFLARYAGEGPVPAEVIAEAIDAPRNYLAKTLHALSKTGLVSGTRGPHGGFRLEVDPAGVPLARIIESFGELQPRRICLLGDRPCSDHEPCEAHLRWKSVCAEAAAPLERTTLANLLTGSGPEPPTELQAAPVAPLR